MTKNAKPLVIARSKATKQSRRKRIDCFAPLAMTYCAGVRVLARRNDEAIQS